MEKTYQQLVNNLKKIVRINVNEMWITLRKNRLKINKNQTGFT